MRQPAARYWASLVHRLSPWYVAKIFSAFLLVDLFQNRIGQLHSVNHPSSLSWIARVRKIFIGCFEPAEIVGIHFRYRLRIRSEQDAVWNSAKNFAARRGCLPNSACRPQFDIHIRIFSEPFGYCGQIFRPVRDVQCHKCCIRMLLRRCDSVLPAASVFDGNSLP